MTAAEADVAGPWLVEKIPGAGWGFYRVGEAPARGFIPAAVFLDRFLALLAAAVIPGTGRDRLLPTRRLAPVPEPISLFPS